VNVEQIKTALSEPGRGRRQRPVEVRETHISWVFLTDDRAYKLKKPLVLPFLDYGTPERRHEMCRQEVALNRRLAPDLYLGIRSLAEREGQLVLAAEDDRDAVDHMVEMRRYDDDLTLDAKLGRGEVTQADVIELARTLAGFHAEAEPAAVRGVPVLAVERRLTENFHELLAVVEQRAEIERVLALERFMHAFVVAHAATLDRRARAGLVRDVHGDLRADHVLLSDPIEIIDCIEFDPALRELDVADDLAFLVMDLSAHGADALARALLDAYRRAGGDPGQDWLVAFYAAYRALVRAKVALIRGAQHPATSAEHSHESASARDLLWLAERFAWRARLPIVIVICGLPAAGKSHLARAVAEASGLAHLSSDVTRKRLAGVSPSGHAPDHTYTDEFSRLTYRQLGRRAAAEVDSGGGAIVDATFRHRQDRDAFATGFAGSARTLFVQCLAPAQVLIQRASCRQGRPSTSDASAAVVRRELTSWEALDEVPASSHVVLRSDRPVEEQLADLLAWLDGRVS
jgi:uncharacterized protein